jgi:hypothetical protein
MFNLRRNLVYIAGSLVAFLGLVSGFIIYPTVIIIGLLFYSSLPDKYVTPGKNVSFKRLMIDALSFLIVLVVMIGLVSWLIIVLIPSPNSLGIPILLPAILFTIVGGVTWFAWSYLKDRK